jgi:quercetin dioxygenase-like cupin family protein
MAWNWNFEGGDEHFEGRSRGFARSVLVGRDCGAVHTDLALCRLERGGYLAAHLHSFERCAYVIAGRPVVELDGRGHQFGPGDYVLFPVGMPHAWRNDSDEEARWVELSSPQPLPRGTREPDTLFPPEDGDGHLAAVVPDLADPRVRFVGHYLGTPPQATALAVDGPARGRAAAVMDTALLAYSGISIKMLVDASLGANLLTMFTVDYEPGGAAQVHDHPFEEAYLFLEGEIEGEIEGKHHVFRAGDLLFCGVGEVHGFFNTGEGRVRWLETQAPQPPRRHSYRWPAHWVKLDEQFANGQH